MYTCRLWVPRTRTRLAIWACETDVDVDLNVTAAGQAVVHGTSNRPAMENIQFNRCMLL